MGHRTRLRDRPSGTRREPGRGQEHHDKLYPTGVIQTAHVNEALFRDAEERYLLASLFHPGQIVQIDRSLPPSKQRAEVLPDGLKHPHGLRKTPFGWMLANSADRKVLLLDDDFRVKDRVHCETSWIQDCALLSSGDVILNDVARSQLVQFAGPPWRPVRVTPYPQLWRGHHMLQVPPEYQAGFRAATARMSARVERAS